MATMRLRWTICWFFVACQSQTEPPPAAQNPPPAPHRAAPAPVEAERTPQEAADIDIKSVLDATQSHELATWYEAVGKRRHGESFGDLVERSAHAQIGKPYFDAPSPAVAETLQCRLDSFQCVSLVESSLSLARCIWQQKTTADCFLHELRSLRYRGGKLDGYPSRLHYYEEWLTDNAQRGHLQLETDALGGTRISMPFSFMTGHPTKFPALVDPTVRAAIAATEAHLTVTPVSILDRAKIRGVENKLRNGDVIAVIGSAPDILVEHTGFISHDAHGVPHLLHASSFRGHVMLSEHDLAQYILRSAERRGVMVARPVAP